MVMYFFLQGRVFENLFFFLWVGVRYFLFLELDDDERGRKDEQVYKGLGTSTQPNYSHAPSLRFAPPHFVTGPIYKAHRRESTFGFPISVHVKFKVIAPSKNCYSFYSTRLFRQ